MRMILFAAVLAFAGCKNKDSDNAAGPSCADAIAKAVGAMPGGPGGGSVQAQLKTIMTNRCTEDHWPAAVINCYATQVTDMASMKKCRETLPPDQQQKLMGEIRTVMMSAAGAGGGPMHGAPSAPVPEGSAAPAANGVEAPK